MFFASVFDLCDRIMQQAAQKNPGNLYLQKNCAQDMTPMTNGRKPQIDCPAMPTVLLVENEPDVLEILRVLLQRSGYTVLAAASGESAIRMCREHTGPVHVLLCDVLMYPGNGFQVVASVKAEFPDVVVFLMSGTPVENFPPSGIPHEFFAKPFTHQELLPPFLATRKNARSSKPYEI